MKDGAGGESVTEHVQLLHGMRDVECVRQTRHPRHSLQKGPEPQRPVLAIRNDSRTALKIALRVAAVRSTIAVDSARCLLGGKTGVEGPETAAYAQGRRDAAD